MTMKITRTYTFKCNFPRDECFQMDDDAHRCDKCIYGSTLSIGRPDVRKVKE